MMRNRKSRSKRNLKSRKTSRKVKSRKVKSRKTSRKVKSRKTSKKVKFNMNKFDTDTTSLITSFLTTSERLNLAKVNKQLYTDTGFNRLNPKPYTWIDTTVKFNTDSTEKDLNNFFSIAENVKELDLTGCINIKDLDGIEKLKTLEYLTLTNSGISDISPLRELKNLKYLNISHTSVVNIEPLSGLTNLRYLDISNTKIDSIVPLSGLDELGVETDRRNLIV